MLKGYRTLLVNALLMIIPLLEMTELHAVLPPDYLPWVLFAAAVGNIVLRLLTDTPVGRRDARR